MKFLKNINLLSLFFLAYSSLFTIQSAHGSSAFSSSATVTYTIESLSNQNSNNSNDLTGLAILGSFELKDSATYNDGYATPSDTIASSITVANAVGSSFSKIFQLDGSISDGSATAEYLALFGLEFENSSTLNNFDIEVSIEYALSVTANGEDADTEVLLDYYNSDDSFGGGDSITASTIFPNADSLTDSDTFNFTLLSGSTETLFIDAAVSGSITASPVPLPSAIWIFSSALIALPRMKKSRA